MPMPMPMPMRQARRPLSRGFTLIELLIVVAVIGVIATILIPNLIDSLQKSKQKRTMADIRNTGNAWMSWLTDQMGAGAAGASGTFNPADYASVLSYSAFDSMMRPSSTFFYVQEAPRFDGWKNEYVYRWTGDVTGGAVMMIGSKGRDGVGLAGDIEIGAFVATDYDRDLIWSDGFFVTWPGSGSGGDKGGGDKGGKGSKGKK